MIKYIKKMIVIMIVTTLVITGCSSTQGTSDTASTATSQATATTDSSGTATATNMSTSKVVVDTEFSSKDLEVGYDESSATKVTLDGSSITASAETGVSINNSTITINSEGTYVFTGTLTDGQIVVDANEKDKIHIILSGANITNSDNAAVYVKSADKVYVTLQENTENTLSDGSQYVQTDDNKVDAVVFSKSDITFNGTGSLKITGNYKHGIVSKDDLVITGGTYDISTVKNALSGKNCVKIKDGTVMLASSEGKGITSKNADDSTKGYVYITGGTIKITKSNEGIEGTVINITGGDIDVKSNDDGFNAASGTSSTADTSNNNSFGGKGGASENDSNCSLSITGGTIKVDASGDGLDSNGSISISGGTVSVSGPTENNNGGLDYNGTANITGGTVVVAGSSGMAQGFSDTSTQYSLLNNFSSTCAAGTEVKLTDASGNVIVSFTPAKEYQSVVISSPGLTKDATYTLTCGSQTANLTLSSVVTSNGQQQGMGGFGKGGHGGMGDQKQ